MVRPTLKNEAAGGFRPASPSGNGGAEGNSSLLLTYSSLLSVSMLCVFLLLLAVTVHNARWKGNADMGRDLKEMCPSRHERCVCATCCKGQDEKQYFLAASVDVAQEAF